MSVRCYTCDIIVESAAGKCPNCGQPIAHQLQARRLKAMVEKLFAEHPTGRHLHPDDVERALGLPPIEKIRAIINAKDKEEFIRAVLDPEMLLGGLLLMVIMLKERAVTEAERTLKILPKEAKNVDRKSQG